MGIVDIVGRSTWGMPGKLGPAKVSLPCRGLWLHHAAGSFRDDRDLTVHDDVYADARAVARVGISRFGRASYSWFTSPASPRGQVLEMQGHWIGAHTAGHNSTTEALVAMGNFQQIEPDADLLWTIAATSAHGFLEGWWPQPELLGGHRDAPDASTACPGSHLHDAIPDINRLARQLTQEDDMFSPDHAKMLERVHAELTREDQRGTIARYVSTSNAAIGRIEKNFGPGAEQLRTLIEAVDRADADKIADALSSQLSDDVIAALAQKLAE